MTATRADIVSWLDLAKKAKCSHLIIGHDPFDNDNFPIFCKNGEECRNNLKRLINSGNRYDEVYDMSLPIDKQLDETRALHIPKEP